MFCVVRTTSAPLMAAACFLLIATPAIAQTADTAILGTVVDATGAVVAGAVIQIAAPASGFSRTLTTNPSGDYELRYLVPGEYQVAVGG